MMNPAPPRFSPPYLGAAYYPEDWPLEQIDADIALMKEAGMNVMRIAEFAWARMEPADGQFDFEWLHVVVDKLAYAGIATVLGTPTCTPPIWLVEKHPEILFCPPDGQPVTHGSRRHACPTSPIYREYCRRIVRQMAEHFGRDPRIIGWQIDNEVYPYNFPHRSCCCPACRLEFHQWLEHRFGTIDALNDAWCLQLWSQKYDRFDQIPTPRPSIWHHPSLLAAWDEFGSRSYIDFVHDQARLLHELTMQPVGTDMMPFLGIDHQAMHEPLDMVQFNHYNSMDNLWEVAFWFDRLRPIKEVPFWNTETSTCWGGGVATHPGYMEPGFCRANTWLPFALGAEANLYWLWRSHWAGHELMHGSVVTSAGRPMHIFGELQAISQGLYAATDFINGTRPTRSSLALHASHRACSLFGVQPQNPAFQYLPGLIQNAYRPLIEAQLRPDVIDPAADLAPYRVLFSPFLPALEEAGLRERLRAWIEAGGIWIAGPLTDNRNLEGAKFTHAPFGVLEEWAAVYGKYGVPAHPRPFRLAWGDGLESEGLIWCDAFESRGAEVLATYDDPGPLGGLAAVTRTRLGGGEIILLGALPSPERLARLLLDACAARDIFPPCPASENLVVVPRAGDSGHGLFVVETRNREGWLELPRPAVNLMTSQRHHGRVEVEALGVMALRYE